MKVCRIVSGAAALACTVLSAQVGMSQMMPMGTSSFAVNLVSPATAPVQIGRGMLMIHRSMQGMGGGMGNVPMMTPGVGTGSSRLGIRLMLTRVTSSGTLVTSSDNHLQIAGSLTSGDGSSQPVDIDESFDLTDGTAVLFVPLSLPKAADPAVLQIDSIVIVDAAGSGFGLPGLRTSIPPTATPGMMPGMSPTHGMMAGGASTMTPRMNPAPTMTPGIGMRMTPHPAATPTVMHGMGNGNGMGIRGS